MVVCGSLPFLRSGTKPAPSRQASAPPKMNPRASMAATWVMPAVSQGAASSVRVIAQRLGIAQAGW